MTVEFGNAISAELNDRAIALSAYLEQNSFPGFVESVPTYASTTVYYDLPTVRQNFPTAATAFEAVREVVRRAEANLGSAPVIAGRHIEIPVHFDSDSSLDLAYIAESRGLAAADVIEIFTSAEYRVYMLGFLPGFTYMGEVDERIATPRKETPRTLIPKGSVGIAGRQTGIYSLESPGGWQIIGRTDVEMFTPNADEPTYLQSGDIVKFTVAK